MFFIRMYGIFGVDTATFDPPRVHVTCEYVTSADIAVSRLAYIAPVENICSLIDIATTGSDGYFERHS